MNKMSSKSTRSSHRHHHHACCFCGLSEDNEIEFGKLYKHGDVVTHYYCLLLSSNMEQKGKDSEGILGFLISDIKREVRRGKRLTCSYCKKAGATLGCCNNKCKKIFHYPCGLRAGSLNQFFGEFRSFCVTHRPKQSIDIHITKEVAKSNDVTCYICYDKVIPTDSISTIWAPCCKKNAWFHRNCVQQLAMSAGYFFKCPLCNDKMTFQTAMLECGIFIPSQDASWELVPNAFEELLYRHDQCDAPLCLCPKGRKHTSFNAKWELVLCCTCGSQGVHMACAHLKWINPVWECGECSKIPGKPEEEMSSEMESSEMESSEMESSEMESSEIDSSELFSEPGSIPDSIQNNFDSDESDTDISVSKESHVSFISNVSVCSSASNMTFQTRPGPRTFKLKQLKTFCEMKYSSQNQTTEDSVHQEESTSNRSATFPSSTTTNDKVHDHTEEMNLSKEHSKSHLAVSIHDIITLDTDNDVVEITTPRSLNISSMTDGVSKPQTNDLSRSRNGVTEIKDSRDDNANIPTSSNNKIKRNILKKSRSTRSQSVELCDDLEDTILVNQESEGNYNDTVSSLKITNIISLAPEEFESMSSLKEGQETKSVERVTPESSFSQHDVLDTRMKRKIDSTTLTPTSSPIVKAKKLRGSGGTCKRDEQSPVFADINVVNIVTPVNDNGRVKTNTNAVLDHASNKNNSVAENTSNNEIVRNVSVTFSKREEKENDNNMTVCNVKDKTPESIKVDSGAKNCDGDAGSSPALKSGSGSFPNQARIGLTKQCGKSDHFRSTSDRSNTPSNDQRRSQDDTQVESGTTTRSIFNNVQSNRNPACDYSRLIPEHIRLRDLKFRVHNTNSLQMILYDKFSVNMNTESVTAVKNTRLDTPVRKTVQQKSLKSQCEGSSNFKSEDILQATPSACNRDKYNYSVHLTDQNKNYQDDTKENLDPVAAMSCKNTLDSFHANATLIESNLPVSTTNNNNIEEDDRSSKAAKEVNKLRRRENISLIGNVENADMGERPNVTYVTTNSNEKRLKSINGVKEGIQSLSSDHVTSSIVEMYSATVDTNKTVHGSKKLVPRVLFPEDRANCGTESETGSTSGERFKVSIELTKIENFVDSNPNLFSKSEEENRKRSLENVGFPEHANDTPERIRVTNNRRVTRSVIDELKHLEEITVICKGNRVTESGSRSAERAENVPESL